MQSIYVCPGTRRPLRELDEGLLRDDGLLYPFIGGPDGAAIPNFLVAQEHGEGARKSLAQYDHKASSEIYRNFLDWLFLTFGEDEASFRKNLVARLKLQEGSKVLVTGCGLGDDVRSILEAVGPRGAVYANDLAAEMVVAAWHHLAPRPSEAKNLFLSVCDAHDLPFPDDLFDGAFHFGGINLFDDMKRAIGEMERVVRPGGRVVFGDEGVAPWLRNTEYGRMAITNNALWASAAPLDLLPSHCVDVHLSWVLGNCFYVVDFEVSAQGPFMNPDVPHKGRRGGSMRTRHSGQLEGVTEESKAFVLEDAARRGISVHDWLEQAIRERKGSGR